MIGYAPGDALPARQPEKQIRPISGDYFGNPLPGVPHGWSCTPPHVHPGNRRRAHRQ
jgi:hypothetical protein